MNCETWNQLGSTYERLHYIAHLLASEMRSAESPDHREIVEELFHETCGRLPQLKFDRDEERRNTDAAQPQE